ncbi:MAG TPA: hypothetical protein EYP90_00020 [Chromatiaceae bacterium]|nr:hypothetical protein [Chromatiaceae bacterium]
MKRLLILMGAFFLTIGSFGMGYGDPLEELLEEFEKQYEATRPPSPYSSVNSDYKLRQAALGTFYTTKAIGLLYRQNQELMSKYNEMLKKYDQIIEQNKEIIRILSTIAKKRSAPKGGKWEESEEWFPK